MSEATPEPDPTPAERPASAPRLGDGLSEDLPDPTESMHLVRRHQAGEEGAIEELLTRYQDRLRRIVRIRLGARLRERLESMDIVQEVNLLAFRKLGEFELRGQGSLLNWLSRLALNQVRDAHERFFVAGRRAAHGEVPLEPGPGRESSEPRVDPSDCSDLLPEERAWQRELREILDEAVTKLSNDHQEVVLLRDYCGMSWEEVARELGRDTVGAAQELHRRAWIRLRGLARPRLNGLM